MECEQCCGSSAALGQVDDAPHRRMGGTLMDASISVLHSSIDLLLSSKSKGARHHSPARLACTTSSLKQLPPQAPHNVKSSTASRDRKCFLILFEDDHRHPEVSHISVFLHQDPPLHILKVPLPVPDLSPCLLPNLLECPPSCEPPSGLVSFPTATTRQYLHPTARESSLLLPQHDPPIGWPR